MLDICWIRHIKLILYFLVITSMSDSNYFKRIQNQRKGDIFMMNKKIFKKVLINIY